MTRRLRGVGALLVAGLAAALLSGCGGGTLKAADVNAPGFGDDAHGTVTVWCRADTEKAEEEIATRFNATHKGLHVVVTPIVDTEYETKLATAIRGGYVPDVVDSDDINAQLFIYHDAFDNLTPLIDKLPYRNQLAKAMLNLSVHDGRYYGVPFSADISLLYYNKSLFQRAGLNPNDPPSTMSQVVSDARRITALGHGITGYSFGGDQAGILGFTEQPPAWAEKDYLFNGVTGHQTADIAHNVALAQTLQDLRTIWRAHDAPASDRTQTGATWGKDFATGTVGMWPGNWGTLVADDIKFPLGVEEIPGPTHGVSAFAGGDNVGIPAGAKNPSGAWEYIKFALQPAQQELLPSIGFTPVRTNLIDSAAVRRYAGTTVGEKALMGSAYAPNTIAYETVINEESGPFEGMFLAGIYGHEPIAKVLSQYQSQFDSAVDEAQS